MGMVIHDDFWAAAKAMPEKHRAPFLYAVIAYRFEGEEPKGNPPWLPTFLVIKDRIELGDKASEKGRKMAAARWGKKNAGAGGGQDAQAHAQADAQAYAAARNNPDAEDEYELGVVPPYNPPAGSGCEGEPFWVECLKALNAQLGTAYTTMPADCVRTVQGAEGRFSVEEVAGMVAFKRDWARGTRWSNILTPNTLFSRAHFEQYMGQFAESKRAEVRSGAKYD